MRTELKTEKEYLNVLKNEPSKFKNFPLDLKSNKEFILKAIDVVSTYYCHYLTYMSESLRDDKDVMLKLIEKDYEALEYASVRLMKDKDIAIAHLKQSNGSFDYLHYELVNELNYHKIKEKSDAIKYFEAAILKESLEKDLSANSEKVKKPKI